MSLAGARTFGECFPEIAAMHIEVAETRLPFGAAKALRVFTMENHPGEHVACSAYLCCAGGFQIGEMLDRMVRHRTTSLSAVIACQGYRGSPKGRRRYGPCSNEFSVSITLSFAEGDARARGGIIPCGHMVQGPVVDRLAHVRGVDVAAALEVGDGTDEPQNPVVRAR